MDTKLKALIDEANVIIKAFKDNSITDDQRSRLTTLNGEIEARKADLDQIKAGEALLAGLGSEDTKSRRKDHSGLVMAKSLGEHVLAQAGDMSTFGQRIKSGGFQAAEFKAATDAHTLEGLTFETVTQTVIEEVRPDPTVANLLTELPMSNPLVSYFRQVPDSTEGAPGITAEGAEKPYVRYKFEQVKAGLSKIAGVTDVTTEMAEDAPFLVSLINTFLIRDLILEEENQILNGDGTGDNLVGLYNTDGVLDLQPAPGVDAVDAIYKAVTAIHLATKRNADGILIHPVDYENIRLQKDANGQYLAGGPFYAPYGNGQIQFAPSPWGLRTVVTPNATQGVPLVGSFKDISLLRKGGISVAASEHHDRNFTQNKITFRAEERVGLMVQRAAAVAKVALATG